MSHPLWIVLDPRIDLGPYLPYFLVEEDQRKAAEQFNERYRFGGWQPFGQGMFTLSENYTLTFPGDPPLRPKAMTKLRDETILLYQSDVVVIMQPDRSFEVCRMD